MEQREFLDLHKERLQTFVSEQKEDFIKNLPNDIKSFIDRRNFLVQQIIDKSDLLISEIFIEHNLDFKDTINFKGTNISVLQYLLLGVSSNNIVCFKDFDSLTDEILLSKFNFEVES